MMFFNKSYGRNILDIKYFKSNLFNHVSTVFLWDNVAKVISIFITIVLIRILNKDGYALYTMFDSSSFFFSDVISAGAITAFIRFASEEYSLKKCVPKDIFAFTFIVCVSFFIILVPFVTIFSKQLSVVMFNSNEYYMPLFLGFIGSIGLFFLRITTAYYQTQERYKESGFILGVQKLILLLLLLLILAIMKLNFLSIAALQIIITTIVSLIFLIKIYQHELVKEKLNLIFLRAIGFFRTSFWLILYCVSLALFSQLNIFMISRLKTVNDLANFGVANKYYGLLLSMFPSIMTVLRVRNSKIDMVENIEKQKAFVKKWIYLSSIIAVPFIIIVIIFSDTVMNLLNGPRYAEAIVPFKILAISSIFTYVFAPNISIFISMKKYFLLFFIGLLALVLSFSANNFLIPIYGISGAAIATLVTHLLINGFATIYVVSRKIE